ncbi:MAG TPA: hypothetical protein VHC63_15310 [Acidimicrobiales bacterium]|nr:hypothetical protein [Acidimicrobiales bacterium]
MVEAGDAVWLTGEIRPTADRRVMDVTLHANIGNPALSSSSLELLALVSEVSVYRSRPPSPEEVLQAAYAAAFLELSGEYELGVGMTAHAARG